MSAIARIYQFHVERAKRRPFANISTPSLLCIADAALRRRDDTTLELIITEVKRRRAAQELAK